MSSGIEFIGFIVLVGLIAGVFFRTIALSPLSKRLTAHQVWVYDVSLCYGWLFSGLAFYIVMRFAQKLPLNPDLYFLLLYWLGGWMIICFVPEKLVKLIWKK